MVQTGTEVSEAEAEGKIKNIYEDIKATLRVPFVAPAFRVLATDPDFLQIAWASLKPNAQTAYFEYRADEIRRFDAGAAASTVATDGDEELRSALSVLQYAEPKLFLAVEALRSAANGQQPKLSEVSREEKRQVVPGVPDAMSLAVTDLDRVDPAAREVLDDVQAETGNHLAASDLVVLARWPDFLRRSWQSVSPALEQAESRRAERALRALVEETVAGLPYRMDIGPHTMRHAGLTEQRIDAVRATLEAYYRASGIMVLTIAAFASGALGKDAATASPFPPAIL